MTPQRRAELHAAYLDTAYRVDGPDGSFTIHVGERSNPLEKLLSEEGVRHWAFVTACNPHSQQLPDDQNAVRMSHLIADISVAGLGFHPGEAIARATSWPPEPSLLILDIAESSAIELARRYGQNAIVCGAAGEAPRLVWIELVQ